MGMEDTWYDYYRGPSSAPSFSEKFTPQAPNLTITTASPAPLSPAPSAAFDQHAGLDYAPALLNNVWREDERRAAIKAKHGRERQLVGLILEVLCQIAGFTCAIVFGIWAVKSYNVSVVALKVQTVANQLALRSLCADDPTLTNGPHPELCTRVLLANPENLWDAGYMSDPMIGTEIAVPKLSLGGIVGIVIGSVAAILVCNIIWAVWRRRSMIMQLNSHVGTDLANLEAGNGSGLTPHGTIPQLYMNAKSKSSAGTSSTGSTSTVAVSSTPYSGNPLTPSTTPSTKKQWTQPSHVSQIY
ncbi:hypothetical protein TWF225_010466 [Orbilia oligospora]|uniref:Uncharacterized protein n=1 Tax=Orbilia oligospora TaxID=2813651 RepID=A0A7C8PIT2_ORBOL|nr:hypothetical protein TWF751_007735 [Orbilia oligospora]KAF3171784.1 hypothetical protein TWF225_010466 [Orbilia oligospora]KAF3237106.1 hypothetical protein TWF128_001176 [Orbilia oligospora]KAF3257327.1 hypothetical protein TWF217_006067 [Orbilia oligospora]KAF3283589.1 hypothetical protein TWF132_010039 [Orbilia oligospora]